MSNYTNTEYQETNLERKGVCLFERKKELKKLSLYYNIWQITILISFLRGLGHEKKWKKRKNRLEFRFALFRFEAKITKVKRSKKFEAKRSEKKRKKRSEIC